jgi:hypothetical protein
MKTRRGATTKSGVLLLNAPMLNDKKLADCTGEECVQFSEIYGRFATEAIPPRNSHGDVLPLTGFGCALLSELFTRLAAEVGPKNKVGDALSEQEVRAIWGLRR